ncbi:heme ABC transporter ATP-binding protein [Hymenobacter aerilatus]|uniref:Heme ABC transporter ATP-binding protein n=1 Tax=Hymenobacter aerilatus TaxID=2932251 RepID=A0A8T9T001_9BACT|nr:heme ABC transporter ATP-binding protein [Hymenobacter aerilatus]UOR06303.1 heme ABC transporter ATP-binding protein [Hymenobacter aerilatus]
MFDVQNISYHIGRKTLLQQVSFCARPGELMVILGANGAGKSTLLRLLSGDLLPSGGSIFFQGQPLMSQSPGELAQQRAVLTQQHALALAFSVEELVMMGRYPRFGGQPSARDYHVVETALAMVGMTSMAQRSYPTLSGGEQQRVQLARVLAQVWEADPGYLLLDEPLTGLDLHHQHRTLAVARELVSKGFGVVAVLHDLNLAAQFADQVLLLHQGQPLAYGPPAQVLTAANILVGFDLPVQLVPHPHHDCPLIVPCPTVNW